MPYPLREGAKVLSGEISRETLSRNCWRNESRAWIEVRGLGGDDDGELGRVVVDAIRAHPGVTSVSLNHPLSRAVVDIDDPGFSLRDLCRTVEAAEKRCGEPKDESVFKRSLPGDGVVLATRALTVAVNATGLGVALTGRALGVRPLPAAVSASVTFVDYQPWLRRAFADRFGGPTTDTVLTLAAAAGQTLTQSPTSLALGLTMQSMKAAEARAEAQSWARHEPELARHADQPRTAPGAAAAAVPTRGADRGSFCAPAGAQRRGTRRGHPQFGHGRRRDPGHHPEGQPDHARGIRLDPGPRTGRPARGPATAAGKPTPAGQDRRDRHRPPNSVHRNAARGPHPWRRQLRACPPRGTAPSSCWRKTACVPAGGRCAGYRAASPNPKSKRCSCPCTIRWLRPWWPRRITLGQNWSRSTSTRWTSCDRRSTTSGPSKAGPTAPSTTRWPPRSPTSSRTGER